jgi:hypothetical protein
MGYSSAEAIARSVALDDEVALKLPLFMAVIVGPAPAHVTVGVVRISTLK